MKGQTKDIHTCDKGQISHFKISKMFLICRKIKVDNSETGAHSSNDENIS
jgi:hypothetical protein